MGKERGSAAKIPTRQPGFSSTHPEARVLDSPYMFWALLAALLLHPSLSLAVESHPGLEAEAAYSEAVVAFHRKQSLESLEVLNRLLRENPEYVPALELKALNLKNLGRDKDLIEVYLKLLEVKPEAERGPLYYELGTLQQKYKKPQAARKNLLKAIAAGFNVVPSHLLVGLIDFTDGNLADAEVHFNFVRREGASELEMLSTFYLGLINFKRGLGALGAGYIMEAREIAARKKDSPMARELSGSIQQILEPFKKSQWFANLSMLGQFDSNIAQIPTSATSQQGSGNSTLKSTLLAGFGYMSAPLSTLQWVPSYRFNTNRNFASDSRTLEYASNTVSLAMNVRPLSRLAWGLKADVTHTFQNQAVNAADLTEGYLFRQFNLSSDIGPYVRWTRNEQLQLLLELSLRPQINFQQSDLGGTGKGARLTYRRDSPSRYFNPSLTLSYDASGTENLTFNSVATALSASNLLRLPGDYQLMAGSDLAITTYADAVPERRDVTATVRGNLTRPLSARWTALGNFSYVLNRSNVPGSFTFNRLQAGVGASYTF